MASEDFDVLIGNREWMHRNTLEVTTEMDQAMSDQEKLGQTAVLVAVNGRGISLHCHSHKTV